MNVGQALIHRLEQHGVRHVFGIPGVHTVELYRGLADSQITHVTPRHEQGAGFMADAYARVSGRPGVCFLITGPGLTNALTAMAQARADSIPMLVISGVNARASLGRGWGYLHELPDQAAMTKPITLWTHSLLEPESIWRVVDQAFLLMTAGRPGPVHLEIPTDVMALPVHSPPPPLPGFRQAMTTDPALLDMMRQRMRKARKPLILAGGGALGAAAEVRQLAQILGAPVLSTINARGIMAGDALNIPASPSLPLARALMREADVVIALGTEFGQTDYDMYVDGGLPPLAGLIRVDIDPQQLLRGPAGDLLIEGDCGSVLQRLLSEGVAAVPQSDWGALRADRARDEIFAALSPKLRAEIAVLDVLRHCLPGCRIVGDSTQPIYAGNLWFDADFPGQWFNSATGYGTLGYAIPAAIGAALAQPQAPVVCITGDGGAQFTLAEMGSAVDNAAKVLFVIWNSHGYMEIESWMRAAGVTPVGVSPAPPDFGLQAQSWGMPYYRVDTLERFEEAVRRWALGHGPGVLEVCGAMVRPG